MQGYSLVVVITSALHPLRHLEIVSGFGLIFVGCVRISSRSCRFGSRHPSHWTLPQGKSPYSQLICGCSALRIMSIPRVFADFSPIACQLSGMWHTHYRIPPCSLFNIELLVESPISHLPPFLLPPSSSLPQPAPHQRSWSFQCRSLGSLRPELLVKAPTYWVPSYWSLELPWGTPTLVAGVTRISFVPLAWLSPT